MDDSRLSSKWCYPTLCKLLVVLRILILFIFKSIGIRRYAFYFCISKTTLLRLVFIVCTYFSVALVHAQSKTDWVKDYEEFVNINMLEYEAAQELYDVLSEHADNKMSINSITKEELEALTFLSGEQIEGIVEYVYKYKPLKTLSELVLVEPLDAVSRHLLLHFLTLDAIQAETFPGFETAFKYGRSTFMAMAKIPLEKQNLSGNRYLGYALKHQLRYKFQFSDYLKVGFTASQDMGEPFFQYKNKDGYDFYTYYLALQRIGIIKQMVIGRYRLKTGMGLVINNDFNFGKQISLASIDKVNTNIRGHSSASSANFMQGLAATLSWSKCFETTLWTSYRTIDATLTKDKESIATLLKTGLHRTESEMDRKNNAYQWAGGLRVGWKRNGFGIGLTTAFTGFSKPLLPNKKQLYKQFYPEGSTFYNIGVDYSYLSRRVVVHGETAMNDQKAFATINSINYQLTSLLKLTLLQRWYSYRYYSLLGSAFNEGRHLQNESGLFLGASYNPIQSLSITGYVDFAYFPWPKYQVSEASWAVEPFLSVKWQQKSWSYLLRYKCKVRPKEDKKNELITNETVHKTRFSLGYDGTKWGVQTNVDVVYHHFLENSLGWRLEQSGFFKTNTCNIFGTISYYNTDDYDSRIYAYERGLLYQFSFPMFYGKGFHYALGNRWDINNSLMLITKISGSFYHHNKKINRKDAVNVKESKNYVEIQLRWKF